MNARHGKITAVVAAAAAVLLLPASADARRPVISDPPDISGQALVGSTLQAVDYEYSGGRDARVYWQWRRCPASDTRVQDCSAIGGADSTSYTVADADVGSYLRVVLTITNSDGWAWASSTPTAAVTRPAPPEPTPTPTPSPIPTPTPTPSPEPTPSPAPVTTPPATPLAPTFPSGSVLGTHKSKPRMMRPAPVVRIRGRTTPGGARITLLTVKAPRGARISLTCRGRSCPVKKWARATTLTRLLRFQRVLAAGTRLTIRVTKPGRIGKYTRIEIRDGLAPKRRDRCLAPGSSKPRRCPSV